MSLEKDPLWLYLLPLWPIGFYGIWAFWNAMRGSREEKAAERSLDWPETQGRVVRSKIVWGHVEIVYEYWISGVSQEGRYKINLPPQFPGGKAPQALGTAGKVEIAEYPVGAKVVVRYNPANPQESVLYRKGEVSPNTGDAKQEKPPHFVTIE
jgi:hypothetical protein